MVGLSFGRAGPMDSRFGSTILPVLALSSGYIHSSTAKWLQSTRTDKSHSMHCTTVVPRPTFSFMPSTYLALWQRPLGLLLRNSRGSMRQDLCLTFAGRFFKDARVKPRLV